MPFKKAAKLVKDGFQGASPMVGPMMKNLAKAPGPVKITPQQKKVMDAVLSIRSNDPKFKKIKAEMAKLPKNATRMQKLTKLYEILKAGGTLGLTYQHGSGRKPRSPAELLKAGKGDCDEFCMLFIASAKKLGINVSNIEMAGITFGINKPGSANAQERHAALIITDGKNKHLFDLTFKNKVVQIQKTDKAGIYKKYRGERVMGGPNKNRLIISVDNLGKFGQKDMVAYHFVDKADYYHTKSLTGTAASKDQNLTNGLKELKSAMLILKSNNSYVTGFATGVGNAIAERYYTLGNAEKNDKKAEPYYKKGIGIYNTLTALKQTSGNWEYDLKNKLATIYYNRGNKYRGSKKYIKAIREYKKALGLATSIVKLKPKEWDAQKTLMDTEMNLGLAYARVAWRYRRTNRTRYLSYKKLAIKHLQQAKKTATAAATNFPLQSYHTDAVTKKAKAALSAIGKW